MNSENYVQFGNNSLKILIYINSEKHIELGNKNSNINSGKIFNFG